MINHSSSTDEKSLLSTRLYRRFLGYMVAVTILIVVFFCLTLVFPRFTPLWRVFRLLPAIVGVTAAGIQVIAYLRLTRREATLIRRLDAGVAEQTKAKAERETTIEFLHIVNTSEGLRELIEASLSFFRRQSGCEAMGVRLKNGWDYPYYEVRGFPEEFVLLENSLCSRNECGEIERDTVGNPVIACMCGNVICGRFDPSKPFFSPAGSFWTNSTTQLLATTSDEDRQARTRNRCNGEGYQSVALIPLSFGDQRLGLLQLNDRRVGMFTPEIIAYWERLASYLSIGLAKFRAEEDLKAAYDRERRISQILQKAIVPPVLSIGDDYRIASVYHPAYIGEEVGGDFYDVFRLQDGRVGILIGDVAGKGVGAAARASATQNIIRALAYGERSPGKVLAGANSVLHAQDPIGSFVTAFLAVLDTESGSICYSSAGHPPQAILRTDGSVQFLEIGNLPLGVLTDYEPREMKTHLEPGDAIILYTDGVSEAHRGTGLPELDEMVPLLGPYAGDEPDRICKKLLDAAKEWAEGELRDDTAIVVVQRIG
jgi:hypothetical protein